MNGSLNDDATQAMLKRDSDVFLHQAMSTPCLDTLEAAEAALHSRCDRQEVHYGLSRQQCPSAGLWPITHH